jgi:hypothetical protein
MVASSSTTTGPFLPLGAIFQRFKERIRVREAHKCRKCELRRLEGGGAIFTIGVSIRSKKGLIQATDKGLN